MIDGRGDQKVTSSKTRRDKCVGWTVQKFDCPEMVHWYHGHQTYEYRYIYLQCQGFSETWHLLKFASSQNYIRRDTEN